MNKGQYVIIIHRFPESRRHSRANVGEGTGLGVLATFHGAKLVTLGSTLSLTFPASLSLHCGQHRQGNGRPDPDSH